MVPAVSETGDDASPRAARRRLQNRLNKRNSRQRYRRRHATETTENSRAHKWIIYYDCTSSFPSRTILADGKGTGAVIRQENHHHHHHQYQQLDVTHKQDQLQHGYTRDNSRFCSLSLDQRVAFLARLNRMVLDGFSRRLPRTDLIPAVHQFNMIAALSANAASLGLSLESLRHDIPSPFTVSGPSSLPPPRDTWMLPASLQPTDLQRSVPHHPWIDLCPMASVRDMMLLRLGEFDEDELCHDLFDSCGGAASNNTLGIVIWGEPSDPAAYEISEEVIRKWGWVFEDTEVLRHTNYWRRQRGEPSLFLPQTCKTNQGRIRCGA